MTHQTLINALLESNDPQELHLAMSLMEVEQALTVDQLKRIFTIFQANLREDGRSTLAAQAMLIMQLEVERDSEISLFKEASINIEDVFEQSIGSKDRLIESRGRLASDIYGHDYAFDRVEFDEEFGNRAGRFAALEDIWRGELVDDNSQKNVLEGLSNSDPMIVNQAIEAVRACPVELLPKVIQAVAEGGYDDGQDSIDLQGPVLWNFVACIARAAASDEIVENSEFAEEIDSSISNMVTNAMGESWSAFHIVGALAYLRGTDVAYTADVVITNLWAAHVRNGADYPIFAEVIGDLDLEDCVRARILIAAHDIMETESAGQECLEVAKLALAGNHLIEKVCDILASESDDPSRVEEIIYAIENGGKPIAR